MHQPKVLFIGLDGATFDLIKPWAAAGKLPHFQRLLTEGVHGELLSSIPPVTAPSWTSFMTGKNPGKHGLYHFIEPQPNSYELRYTNARSRRAKTVWQLLSEAGVSVGVLNVPMTYPPEAVRGYMVSGLDAPDDSTMITSPSTLYQELKTHFGRVSWQIRYLGYLGTDERRDALLKASEEMTDHYANMTQYLLRHHPVDVMMVVFTATDTVQHFFWQYMAANHPQHDRSRADKYGQAIFNVYQHLDTIIGQLTADLPSETVVGVISDHGAGATSARVFHINRYLEEIGLLQRRETAARLYHPQTWMRYAIARIDAFVRGKLPSQQKARLARLFPRLRMKWEASYTGLSQINWQRTKAYAYEVLTFPSSIWINVQGVRPQGIVQPGAEYEEVMEFITKKLYELQDPVTGKQLIQRIYRKEEVYSGAYVQQAPDLTLEWWNGVTFLGGSSFGVNSAAEALGYVGGQPITSGSWGGGHLRNGVLMLCGQPFQPGKRLEEAEITDIAPTLLYLLGLAIPGDMDGRVLLEAFSEEFTAAHQVAICHTGSDDTWSQDQAATSSDEESRQMEERLRNLGYIE